VVTFPASLADDGRAPLAFNMSVPLDGLHGAVAARETPAQVAGRQRRGWAEAPVCAVGPRRRGQVDAGAQVRCGTSCCSLRRGAGRGWRSTTCPPADDELERAGLRWLMGGFPWAHGRTIITTREAEWVQQGEGLSGSERDRSATLRLVRRGLAHDAKVRQVSAGPLLLRPRGACPSATWTT